MCHVFRFSVGATASGNNVDTQSNGLVDCHRAGYLLNVKFVYYPLSYTGGKKER